MNAQTLLKYSGQYTNLVLDKDIDFVFLSQNKVAQTSINRKLLATRAIIKKDHAAKYAVYRYKTWLSLKAGKSVFAFTIVRHPCDRVVSAFEYLKKLGEIPPAQCFKDFLFRNLISRSGNWYDPHFAPQSPPPPLTLGQLELDYVGYYETLDFSWKAIARQIEAPEVLPHTNKTEHMKFISYYDLESWEYTVEIYKNDFAQLAYSAVFHCQPGN